VGLQFIQLGGNVAPGEDPGVDRRVECLDLAAHERRYGGQFRDAAHLNPFRGEMLAGAVGGDDLDIQGLEVACERRDPGPVRD